MASPEEEFRKFLMRRSSYLYSFENGAIQQMVEPYQRVRVSIYEKLASLEVKTTGFTVDWRIQRLNQQLNEVEGMLQAAQLQSAGNLESTIKSLSQLEGSVYANMLSDQFERVGIDVMGLPYAQIDQISRQPLLGQSIGEKSIWTKNTAIAKMRGELTQAIIQGEDMAQATKRLINVSGGLGIVDKTIQERAKKIARSEIQYASNQVARNVYKENDDILQGVMYSASLDRRTCLICASDDGTIFYYKNGEDHNGPSLPRHPLCRCIYVPITKTWRQLGDKIPAHISKDAKGAFVGKGLDVINYQQWLKTLSKTEQVEILGKKKQILWDTGKIKFDQMVKNNKILNLDQLDEIAEKNLRKKL